MKPDTRVCLNCGGLTVTRGHRGWSCKDPDCMKYLVVVRINDYPMHSPMIRDAVDVDDD